MADHVVVEGVRYKRRNPWGVFALSLITLRIYHLVWYYKINNELRNYGVDNDPTVALLAITIGGFIIVPRFVSTYRTADRILSAQQKAQSSERMIPVLALLLYIVVSGFAPVYYQSQLNKVWDAEASRGAPVEAA